MIKKNMEDFGILTVIAFVFLLGLVIGRIPTEEDTLANARIWGKYSEANLRLERCIYDGYEMKENLSKCLGNLDDAGPGHFCLDEEK